MPFVPFLGVLCASVVGSFSADVPGSLLGAQSARQHSEARPSAQRYVAIDVLKATAIIAVIWIHAFERLDQQSSLVIQRLILITRFAVPAFFFASGFLTYRATPIPVAILWRRLRRILVPYLVASVVAIVGRGLVSGAPGPAGVAFELLTGSAVGVFYFVPMLVSAICCGVVLSYVPRLVMPAAIVLWITGGLSEILLTPTALLPTRLFLFLEFRNPLRWWGYFLAGWMVAAHIGSIAQLTAATRRNIAAAALGLLAALFVGNMLFLPPHWTLPGGLVQYAAIYCAIATVFFGAFDRREHAATRWLSEATYPIYLYHFFLISLCRFGADSMWPTLRNYVTFDAATFVAGCLGSLLVICAGRRCFGRYSQLVIG